MAKWSQYDVVGKKEDVSDIISDITPRKVPFTSTIGTEKSTQVLYQWQEDELRAVQVNAQVEGFDAVEDTLTPTVMRDNTTQILEKTFKVTGTLDATDLYGRAKESAYQASKAGAELKRDLENACIGTKQTKVTGDSATARQFAGVQAQIDAGNIVKTGGASTPLSEANLLTMLQKLWNNGADPSAVMVTGDDSLVIADFAKAAGRYRTLENDNSPNKLVNAIEIYVSPFGDVKTQLNRFLAAGDTLVYDPEMWKLVVFRNWFRETLAKTGDNTKMMIVGEFGLKHKNYKASGLIRRSA